MHANHNTRWPDKHNGKCEKCDERYGEASVQPQPEGEIDRKPVLDDGSKCVPTWVRKKWCAIGADPVRNDSSCEVESVYRDSGDRRDGRCHSSEPVSTRERDGNDRSEPDHEPW